MYIPLNVKTNYCLLSSFNDITNLIIKAKSLNIKTIAITDSTMYGVLDFYKQCVSNNIKPIIGTEININDKAILLYAMNYEGYQNLTKLLFLKQEADITLDIVKKYSHNLICIIPNNAISLYNDLATIFIHLYLGYSNLKERDQNKEYQQKQVFINEVLYLNKADQVYLKYLYLIKDAKKITNLDEYEISDNHYLLSYEEIDNISDKEDLKNMDEIDKLCNISFSQNKKLLPRFNNDEAFDAKIYLQSLCKAGLKKRLDNNIPNLYVERLKYELSTIDKMGFNDYFLVVWDFVKYAKSKQILVHGRGSAAGSLVSYCLGITDIDPLQYDLLFERFLNPERITMPDIDLDFDSIRRSEIVEYAISKYGLKYAAPIITFVNLGGKQAIRDVARLFDYTSTKIDVISKLIDLKLSLIDNFKNNEAIKKQLSNDKELTNIYKIASFIEGAKRQISVHAAGIVISNLALDSYIPLCKYGNYYITGFSMEHLEELGLLKIDFLGLKNFTLIDEVLAAINKDGSQPFSLNSIAIDDKKTLSLFNRALTSGIFQFETPGMKNLLRKLKPDSFEELVAAVALFRPGPMANIDSYIRRKQGQEKIDYLHPSLEKILQPTYGIIIYQEQIMQIAHIMAGYSLGEADILRRAMSKKKKDVLDQEQDKFIKRSVDKGYSLELSSKVYALILKFANYGFPRAHAVVYAYISYKMAYLKVHYTEYFMSSLLTNNIGNETKTKEYVDECRILGINILKPDINLSNYNYTVKKDGIIFSLASIHNIGGITCKEIIKERQNGLFTDFFDFVRRTYGKAVTKAAIESLINADCFKDFGYNHQTLISNIDNVLSYADLSKKTGLSTVEKPMIEILEEMDKSLLSENEIDVFGFYLSDHPVLKYKAGLPNIINLNDVANHYDKIIDVVIYVDKLKITKTKNNEEMAFITGSDETSNIDLVMFPSVYKDNLNIEKKAILKIKARVEKRMSRYQLSVIKVEILANL